MIFSIFKICTSAGIIAFASWLSGKRPELAGFITALPIVTLLVLPFSHIEYNDPQTSVQFARSIFLAVPLSLSFFVPFLLADKLPLSFWGLYIAGLVLLSAAYFIHRGLMSFF